MPAATAELKLEPSLEEARELAREGNVVPVRARLVDDCETPVSAFLKLRAAEPEGAPCFLLESAEQGQVGRYSFVGLRPRALLRWSEGTLTEWSGEGLAAGEPPLRSEPAADPYAAVAERLGAYRPAPVQGLPPFAGGAVGFFGYDLVRTVEPLGEPNPDPLGLPDLALMVTDAMLVFDHLRHELTILACAFADDEGGIEAAYASAAATIAEMRQRLRGPVPVPERAAVSAAPEFNSNFEREEFEAAVARIVEYVHAGDAFQVVPSQRFSAPAPVEAFSVYRGLRAVNPSPYMYFLEFGDFQLAGASPEPLVKVSEGRVEARPIAGTYARGKSEEEDRRLAERLVNDAKERAEHVMLVDLARNDLGRVCEYGSVAVDELMVVETYSHVLHIVSQVSGTLRERRQRPRRAALGAAGRHPLGGAEGAGDADHRRARAGQALLLRRRHRLPLLGRRPRHRDPHPHRRRQGRPAPRPGRRRHRRRRQAGLRVQRVGEQGEGGVPRGRGRLRTAGLGLRCASW